MKALVTGSAGFIGRHMVAELESRGWDVHGYDIAESNDCLDVFRLGRIRYDLVVHAAARSPHRMAIDTAAAMHPYNALLDAAMFEWAIRTDQGRVLYLSSCAVLDGPVDDYAITKLHGEWLAHKARACGIPVTIVRPYSGYGEDQGTDWPFGAFMDRARRHVDPFDVWGDGSQLRDWIHIDDVVKGALAVADAGTTDVVSLCTGFGVSMAEVALLACTFAGYAPRFVFRADKPAGVAVRVGNPTRLREFYTPTITIEQGIKRAIGGAQ